MKNYIKFFLKLSLGIFPLVLFHNKTLPSSSFDQNKKIDFYEDNVGVKNYLKNYSNDNQSKTLNDKRYYSLSNSVFQIPDYLKSFLYDLTANLKQDSTNKKINLSEVEIYSDTKSFSGTLLNAEGNVFIRSNNATLNSNSFSFDQDLKIMVIEGDIRFKTEKSFLEASKIKYDFINKKGYILNAYGSADFKDLSKTFVSKESKNPNKKMEDNFDYAKEIKDVKFNNSSNIKFQNLIRKYENGQSFSKSLTSQELEVNFNRVVQTRFISEKIEIEDDVWFAKSLTLTNDPFNKPQLTIKNKNFKTSLNEEKTKIRSRWSTAMLENKIPIPLGPRRIDVEKYENFKWGNGYDKTNYDGFYIFRRFNQIELDDNTELSLTSFFPIQRIIVGKTKAFPNNDDLVIAPKVKKDANFYDFFGIEALLKREKEKKKFIFELSANSLDFEKLDKSIKFETYYTVNLFEQKSKNLKLKNEVIKFIKYSKNRLEELEGKVDLEVISNADEIRKELENLMDSDDYELIQELLNKLKQELQILENLYFKRSTYKVLGIRYDKDTGLPVNQKQSDLEKDFKENEEKTFRDKPYEISKDLTFFGSYRDKTKNGSLGEITVKSSYGVRLDESKRKEKNKTISFSEKSYSIGNYESSSRLNSQVLINKNRFNFSYKKGYEFPIWMADVDENINENYKFSPTVIPKGLYWSTEGSLDIFRYDDGSFQDMLEIKTGPKLTLGDLKRNFLDYTEISIRPRFRFSRGESPFAFDRVVDKKVVELKASQQIYGPIVLSFTGLISLDKEESNNDKLINPEIDLAWKRRAYSVNLFYNLDTEVGGLNFSIYTFNFKGLGEKFN